MIRRKGVFRLLITIARKTFREKAGKTGFTVSGKKRVSEDRKQMGPLCLAYPNS